MEWLNRWFGNKEEHDLLPELSFGRYSDRYKEAANYEAWEQALLAFEQERYLDSFRHFFQYLRDDRENNVRWQELDGEIQFEFFQGSKKIIGTASAEHFKACAKIAHTQDLRVPFMRRLLEKNFELKYSRFALDDQHTLVIIFDTPSIDGAPYKLYFALKEMAVNADKQDDLLLEEFSTLQPVDVEHLEHLPEPEKEVKYQFIQSSIGKVIRIIEEGPFPPKQYPVPISFLLLDLIYKLDYLIKPEGYTMECLERMHRTYFAKDDRSAVQKNQALIEEFEKLRERPKADFFKEMYRVRSTFGITNPVNHARIVEEIDSKLPQMQWYLDKGHLDVALSIPSYILGYSLFNYAMPRPDRELFHLYFRVTEADFFRDLGFPGLLYDQQTGKFNRRGIRKAIDAIVGNQKARYPRLQPALSKLSFESLPRFTQTYLQMVRELDLTKAI